MGDTGSFDLYADPGRSSGRALTECGAEDVPDYGEDGTAVWWGRGDLGWAGHRMVWTVVGTGARGPRRRLGWMAAVFGKVAVA